MSCSADSLHGIVNLTGPIKLSDIEKISSEEFFPLSFSFSSQSTIPVILGINQIEGNLNDSCFYNGKRYNLLDIQICSVLHNGYKLPTENQTPVAECILTYKPAATDNPVSAILLCLPIYFGDPSYDGYFKQIVTDSDITCGYDNQTGKIYDGEEKYAVNDASLSKCIKTCCDDTNCLAYTFQNGKCSIKHTIPNLLSTNDSSTISGKINRGQTATRSCSSASSSSSASPSNIKTVESLFYNKDGTTDHRILSYQACFETVTENLELLNKYSIHVTHFSKGIRMDPTIYRELLLKLQGNLIPYQFPPVLRNFERTLLKYRMSDGKKIPTESSTSGELYSTALTCCSKEFKNFFKYSILPNRSKTTNRAGGTSSDGSSCKQYTTEQYKCVPFNELTDLSGNVVIPGNMTLEQIRKKREEMKNKLNKPQEKGEKTTLTPGQIEGIIGGSIGGIIFIFLLYSGFKYFLSRKVDTNLTAEFNPKSE